MLFLQMRISWLLYIMKSYRCSMRIHFRWLLSQSDPVIRGGESRSAAWLQDSRPCWKGHLGHLHPTPNDDGGEAERSRIGSNQRSQVNLGKFSCFARFRLRMRKDNGGTQTDGRKHPLLEFRTLSLKTEGESVYTGYYARRPFVQVAETRRT